MNLKSQKGATGADIVISITVILITVAIVSMIYVNTTLQGRNVNRTAGATRIATNIIENINKMTYDEFVSEYSNNWTEQVPSNYSELYAGYKGKRASQNTVFNTKIPNGYIVYLKAEPTYGVNGNSRQASEKFDLVRDVKLAVIYSVGDRDEKVELSTVKSMEIINEINMPETNYLIQQGITRKKENIYPIKYLKSADSYVKTDESDLEWYKYSEQEWAMVIVSQKNETELFDVNGRLIANLSDYDMYTWIPRFFYSEENVQGQANPVYKFAEFQYLLTNNSIQEKEITSVNESGKLVFTSFGTKKIANTTATDMGNKTGKWIKAMAKNGANEINNDSYGKILNESIYGPCNLH